MKQIEEQSAKIDAFIKELLKDGWVLEPPSLTCLVTMTGDKHTPGTRMDMDRLNKIADDDLNISELILNVKGNLRV